MPSGLMSNYSHSSANSKAGDMPECGAEDPRPWGRQPAAGALSAAEAPSSGGSIGQTDGDHETPSAAFERSLDLGQGVRILPTGSPEL
jgi:hypothetical protein